MLGIVSGPFFGSNEKDFLRLRHLFWCFLGTHLVISAKSMSHTLYVVFWGVQACRVLYLLQGDEKSHLTIQIHAERTLCQGPLNIRTEHSNCKVHSRGDSKILIALLIPNIFLIFFMKLFFYEYISWGHDPIWYFSYYCRKFSELRALLFWALLKPAKIWNLSKNAHVWAA